MTRKKNRRHATPDESFSFGPITASRFGRNIVWESNWPEGAFIETQRRLVEHYPEVVRQIDSLVDDIATLVIALPADQLLQRAWWEMADHAKIESERSSEVQHLSG